MRAALLAVLACAASPAPAQEAEWFTLNSPASGWIGTDPHDPDFLLYEDQDGVVMPVIWEAENAVQETLAGCEFEADPVRGSARGPRSCPVELLVDGLLQNGNPVIIVRRLVALGKPGQQMVFD